MAQLCGFPGKLGMERRRGVGQLPRAARSAQIRNYCETDCANTYLLYLRFQLMRCALRRDALRPKSAALLRAVLEKRAEPHWAEFLSLWKT